MAAAVGAAAALAMIHPPRALACAPGRPVNTEAPRLSGSAVVGGTLTTSNGSWWTCGGIGISYYSYQWFRAGQPIAGATSNTYTVTSSDDGKVVSARVTATDGLEESASADSDGVLIGEEPAEEDSPEAPMYVDQDPVEPADPDPVDSSDPDASDDDAAGMRFAATSQTLWPVTWNQNHAVVKFRNADGVWSIYKQCIDRVQGDFRYAVGIGYIARFQRGTTLYVNDYRGRPRIARRNDFEVGGLNDVEGGLGTFGWHHARGAVNATPAGDDPTTTTVESGTGRPYPGEAIEGRMCAPNARNGNYGIHARAFSGPKRQSEVVNGKTRRYVAYTVDVWFRDALGNTGFGPLGQKHSLVKVRYRYSFYRSSVRAWISVLVYPRKDIGGIPFIKEPKLSATLQGGNYRRISAWGDSSSTAGPDSNDFLVGVLEGKPNCLYTVPACNLSTDHSPHNNRNRVQWNFGTDHEAAGSSGCSSATPCFNVVMRGYPTGTDGNIFRDRSPAQWERGGLGLDAWAQLTATVPLLPSYPRDTKGATLTTCGAGRVTVDANGNGVIGDEYDISKKSEEASPDDDGQRRWELGGFKASHSNALENPNPYDQSMVLFTGWTGGNGPTDCEPLQREFPKGQRSWGAFAVYSLGEGWVLAP